MRYTEAFIPTLKEMPADAEAISHKLMVRAGLIRKLIAGAYSYLPIGFRILKRIEAIVREEMDKAGAHEILMPILQPAELWHETGRYAVLGEELVRFNDRNGKEMVIGPTHEEVITDIARNEFHSYKDLPKIIYQIQIKVRDEPRPRFGVIRSKEFIMKDAYSFDRNQKGMDESYKKMRDCYYRIFKRCGLETIAVEAESGFMGGSESVEFMVLSDNGEDVIAVCTKCDYKASLGKASCSKEDIRLPKTKCPAMEEVQTPGLTTIQRVSNFLKCKPQQMIKTLIYIADNKPIAVLIRGDHEVNEAKLKVVLKINNLVLADEKTIEIVTGGPLGFSGPVGLKGVGLIIDHAVCEIVDGVTGANKKDVHMIHILPGRDFPIKETFDIRYITDGEPCRKCQGAVQLKRAIEVGHIFKLGTKYSDNMKARFLDADGKKRPFIMGCYGIGINRIMAAAIEQNNDKDGIIWPLPIAPYQVIVVALNMDDRKVVDAAEKVYEEFKNQGIEVLYDNRQISAGIKFKDADLIGIPLQVIIGSKNIQEATAELKIRLTGQRHKAQLSDITSLAKKCLTTSALM